MWSGKNVCRSWGGLAVLFSFLLLGLLGSAGVGKKTDVKKQAARVRLDPGHPWRPPFGLERIGRPLEAVVEIDAEPEPRPDYWLAGFVNGREMARHRVPLGGKLPYTSRVAFESWPAELRLLAKPAQGEWSELARLPVKPTPFEAEAIARPDVVVNPVDLGAILVPTGWLILGGGQGGSIEVAGISRTEDVPRGRVTAWFESLPRGKISADLPLMKDRPARVKLRLPAAAGVLPRDVLHVGIEGAGGKELWHKKIPTMLVQRPPSWPRFGAVQTRLRYDAPISVRADNGTLSSLSYDKGWDPRLQDVAVFFPNGARFVFWRGSCYIPFWAGRYNTGLSYEWAETSPPPDGFDDCVEPLMDKELRYGRVRIVESTPARVHVRWTYQSCDFKYKVWGDSAVEDFYFYPDAFGTRVLTLQSAPTGDYELSEFIVLTPQATYPLDVLPRNLVDILFVDGQKRELYFPFFPQEQGEKVKSRDLPAIYRARLHKDESLAAVYFNPLDRKLPPAIFAPFRDRGYLVTPCYWGSHWPLARGKTTSYAIDERIHLTPCHNSVMSWARSRPAAVRSGRLETIDTLGRSRPMVVQTWAWLIGMSDASDEGLLEWAQSYSRPPGLELVGARLAPEPYSPERRAICLSVEDKQVKVTIKPAPRCVNPVFELAGTPGPLAAVHLADRQLGEKDYAWDGKTLWIRATLSRNTSLRLEFADRP